MTNTNEIINDVFKAQDPARKGFERFSQGYKYIQYGIAHMQVDPRINLKTKCDMSQIMYMLNEIKGVLDVQVSNMEDLEND